MELTSEREAATVSSPPVTPVNLYPTEADTGVIVPARMAAVDVPRKVPAANGAWVRSIGQSISATEQFALWESNPMTPFTEHSSM